jgi:3-hydroxy-9,10-secoandrosta-1,3,5(10)-triene-9,17-dione monooxygenase reductase component
LRVATLSQIYVRRKIYVRCKMIERRGNGVAIDSRTFRDVLGTYPTGVCVVTSAAAGGQRWGMTVGTFTSISLDPPMVGFMPGKASFSWQEMSQTHSFCINILGADQQHLSSRFSSRAEDKFAGVETGVSPGGLPILANVLGWIECAVVEEIELGDHLLIVGQVQALARGADGEPLLFYRGTYHSVAPTA